MEQDATLVRDLELLIEPLSRGDPESPLRWTCKSVRKLAQELGRRGHRDGETFRSGNQAAHPLIHCRQQTLETTPYRVSINH